MRNLYFGLWYHSLHPGPARISPGGFGVWPGRLSSVMRDSYRSLPDYMFDPVILALQSYFLGLTLWVPFPSSFVGTGRSDLRLGRLGMGIIIVADFAASFGCC